MEHYVKILGDADLYTLFEDYTRKLKEQVRRNQVNPQTQADHLTIWRELHRRGFNI